jgi:hypothetical protein
MMAELTRAKAGKKTRTGMSASQLEDFKHMEKKRKPKSYMPEGATLSPQGDIGAFRQEEAVRVGGFKSGSTVRASSELPYRPCKEARDPFIEQKI